MDAVVGDGLPAAERLAVLEGPDARAPTAAGWSLRGVTSNTRCTKRPEADASAASQQGLRRPQATRAALIPIRKTEAWWALAQDEHRAVFEEQFRHIGIGLEYLRAVARRLHHSRDLGGEPFDFLTRFEYAPEDGAAFDALPRRLRATAEWRFIDREVDVRSVRGQVRASIQGRHALVRRRMHIAPPAASPDRPLGTALEAARRRPYLALALLCLALFLPGFFTLPATDRDEARFAQASRQMVESGDHLRIRFGAEERNKKPAGIHWLQSASVQALEATGLGSRADIWAYRVPSLAGAALAVLATFHWGRALVGRRAAFLGAAMLASSLVLVAEAHIAKTDAALLAAVTAAMGLFGAAYLRPGAFTARQAAAFWLALGLGVLLKGPIGPMVPLLAGITLAVADRGAPWLRALRPLWGVPLMLLAAAPWFVAIGIATEGRFFAEAVGGDMLAKVGSGEEKHWGPPGYYLLTFAVAAFPGAFVVLLALPSAWRDRRTMAATRFLLAWVVPSWLLFEAVQTKLPHYTLPLFPALMLLGAAWAMDPLRRMPARRWWRAAAVAGLALVALGLGAAALAAPWFTVRALPWEALLVPPAALLLLWPVLRAARRGDYGRAALFGALLAVLPYAAVLEGVAPRLAPLWIAPRLDALLAERAPGLPASAFGITGHAEPSVLFAVGTGTNLLRTGGDAARFLAEAPGRVVAVGNRAEADFRREAGVLGITPMEIGTVTGLNYTRGRWVTLILYRMAS